MTGATGFIGRRLAPRLVEAGWHLRCLVRHPERAEGLRALGADLVHGDTADATVLRHGCGGADAAIHLAGVYRLGPPAAGRVRRVNVEGTRAFIEAVRAESVPKAVYVSTTGCFRPANPGDPLQDPVTAAAWEGPFPTRYQETKSEAHHLAVAAQDAGVPLMIASPAFVYGAGDEGPAGQLVRAVLRGLLPALSNRPGTFSFVYVDDVAEGLLAVLRRGETGGAYVLGGETATLNDFVECLARVAGVRPPPLRLPVPMLVATGALLDVVSAVTRMTLMISKESVRITTGGRFLVDEEPTRSALHYVPRPLEEGLTDML